MKAKNSKLWWWKEFLALDKGNERRAWFEDSEAAAFYYELARRNFPLESFPTFAKLKRGEYNIAYITLSRKFAGWKPPVAQNHIGKMILHEGYVAFPSKSWNLRASKNALLKTFWQQIEAERIQRGIAEPEKSKSGKGMKSRNAGNVARTKGSGQSWQWLELMDNPHGLTSNGRSHLAAARKKCAAIKADFEQLWKEIEQHRAFLERYYTENPQALQIDREPVKW